jgi:putative membrane protein
MIATAIGSIVSLIHIYIFYLESIAWGKPGTNRAFGVSATEANTLSGFAFNQGFYNLFLALSILSGFAAKFIFDRVDYGNALADAACASVLGAGLVLFFSRPRMIRPAMIQAGPAMAYLGFRVLGY